MPTYLYETLPPTPELPVRRFELKQSMHDAALTHDPGGCCGPGGGACHY